MNDLKETISLYENLGINELAHLTVGGLDCTELAREFETPLYILDYDMIRKNCQAYTDAIDAYLPARSRALYASKALSFKGIYPLIAEMGLGVDAVSPGEIYTALKAGTPGKDICFHGNNKTDKDISFAIDSGVGIFVVDNFNELAALSSIAKSKDATQDILLRITLGIDPHTQEAINTGRIDSQFGIAVDTGQAIEFVKAALDSPHLNLLGFHSHIGSQITEAKPFLDQLEKLVAFACEVRDNLGFVCECFNLGGGFGVKYLFDDPSVDVSSNIKAIGEELSSLCSSAGYPLPYVLLEPGRSIVAGAGTTIYTTGGIKDITGYLNYVTVDGGMADNPRFALYRSPYTVVNASRMSGSPDFKCTIAGRCCESGDRIQEDVGLVKPERGDIIAVLGTGAYNYSMASNYNRLPRPAMISISGGAATLVVRRETFDDLLMREV